MGKINQNWPVNDMTEFIDKKIKAVMISIFHMHKMLKRRWKVK
jgi:hypothetical protein